MNLSSAIIVVVFLPDGYNYRAEMHAFETAEKSLKFCNGRNSNEEGWYAIFNGVAAVRRMIDCIPLDCHLFDSGLMEALQSLKKPDDTFI